nr:PREDICTED: uncharacterized protein LOC109039486 isoform X2 [Bemisia tabaci]
MCALWFFLIYRLRVLIVSVSPSFNLPRLIGLILPDHLVEFDNLVTASFDALALRRWSGFSRFLLVKVSCRECFQLGVGQLDNSPLEHTLRAASRASGLVISTPFNLDYPIIRFTGKRQMKIPRYHLTKERQRTPSIARP